MEPDERDLAIDVRGVSKLFGAGDDAVRALDDVSVGIRRNEFFTLLGPSGCGKTTLLRLIAGFDYPSDGEILLDGTDIAGLPPYRRPVNTVFQSYALFPHMTVAENIGFGLKMLGKPRAETAGRVSAMLKLVRMEALANRQTSQISGGQQQRVALARALAPQPKVLLLDEPLSALDYKLRKEMQIELKRLQHETGITFVFVTHDQEEALTMSDRIAVMSSGSILQIGSPREIYDRPAVRFVADFIGESNMLSGTIATARGSVATVKLKSGEAIEARLSEASPRAGDVTVVIRPEHLRLVDAGRKGALAGRIANIVYSGNDTHFHVETADGTMVVRQQNSAVAEETRKVGGRIGIGIEDGTAQVLAD
ncbi:MAG: ABC transporter ATP-binding protein [Flavobacteriaceae bacterium]